MDIIISKHPNIIEDDDPLSIIGKPKPLKLTPAEFAEFVWTKWNWSIKSIEDELQEQQLTRDEIENIISSLQVSRINTM